ncbi:MAG: hypothetical protein M3044_20305 [Thermoproteota archaeon]|nr:hypothetical protein [Thermoproteota archaeon]
MSDKYAIIFQGLTIDPKKNLHTHQTGEAGLQIMKGIDVISYRDRILRSYIIPR